MRDWTILSAAKDFLVTLPDRIKTSARLLGERIDLLVMSLIDRYLEQRDFKRVATQFEVAFDDLPILYDEGSFPIVPGAVDRDGYLVSRFDLDLLPDGLYTTDYDPDSELYMVKPLVFEE